MYVRTYYEMHMYVCTVEPLYYGHFGILIFVLIIEVSAIQRLVIKESHCKFSQVPVIYYKCMCMYIG